MSFQHIRYPEIIHKIKDIPFVELRLDKSDLLAEEIQKICSSHPKLLATFHFQSELAEQWKTKLEAALLAGAKYLDVGFPPDSEIFDNLISIAAENKSALILSFHDFQKTPDRQTLISFIEMAFDRGASAVKIACHCNSYSDVALLLSLCGDNRPIIVSPMGVKGRIGRLLAPEIGSLFGFVSATDSSKTAQGQLTLPETEYYSDLLSRHKPKLLGVAGNPVIHSKSDTIFEYVAVKYSLNLFYRKILCLQPEDIFVLLQNGFDGLNITTPFKNILNIKNSEIASSSEPVNCLFFQKNRLYSANTDVQGVLAPLRSVLKTLKGKKALVLGAGGAAEAAVIGLSRAGAEISICNRTFHKAELLAHKYNCSAIEAGQIHEINSMDILVNTIPEHAHLRPELHEGMLILDADYKNKPFMDLAVSAKCVYLDGLKWLLGQAVPAIKLFTGIDLPSEVVEQSLQTQSKVKSVSRIFLTGMMLCGKTSIGKILAEKLGYSFLDIDELIEKQQGRSISDIFADEGEAYFRKLETTILKKLKTQKNTVISGGAGIIENMENRIFLKENMFCIWLFSSPETIAKRIPDSVRRPLLRQGDALLGVEKILKRRLFSYADVSDLVVVNEISEIETVAIKLAEELRYFIK